ncbi:MAG: GntR family transcriptional regulator [Kiritimatiellae bacterium]|nr:GntR family transcriptional regulator [Kiritimatiellia bacterium]
MKGHKEVFEALRREILAGKYDADRRLPSEKSLSCRFGVSRPTVSRVTLDLKREGLIVTRKGAASVITRFAQNATGALGLVVPGENYAEIFKPLDRRLAHLADRLGWDLIRGEIKGTDPKVRAREARRLAYQFAKERVCGVFFQPIEFLKDSAKASEDIVRYFEKSGIAVVLLDYDIAPPPDRSRYDVVGIDNFAAGLAIGRHLVRSGAKRIAFLHRPNAAPTVTNRMRGVAAAAVESGGFWSLKGNVLFAEPDNCRAVSKFLKNGLPDAFVAGNDVAAAALGKTLARIGGGAEKIRLAGFDDVEVAAKLGLTTVRQPLDAIAEVAMQTLVSRIKTPDLSPRTILLDAEIVVR